MLRNENGFNDRNANHHQFDDNYLQTGNSGDADDVEGKKAGKWTGEEDELLRKYVPLYGEKQWRKIAEHIPGRNSIQCLHRWTKILKPGLVKGPWTPEEDGRLLAWVKAEGPTKWAQCAVYIQGRSGKQCRERWLNNLNPDLKKGGWTEEEDEAIFQLYQQYGSSWSKIAKSMPGRTENAIKNRFYSTLRKLAADKKKLMGEGLIGSDDHVKQEGNDPVVTEPSHEMPQYHQTQQPAQNARQYESHDHAHYQREAAGHQQQMQSSQMQAPLEPQNALYKRINEAIVPHVKAEPVNYRYNNTGHDHKDMDMHDNAPQNFSQNINQKPPNQMFQKMAPHQPQQQFQQQPQQIIQPRRAGYYTGPEYGKNDNQGFFPPNFEGNRPQMPQKSQPMFQNQGFMPMQMQKQLPTIDQLMAQENNGDQDESESQFEKFLISLDKIIDDDYFRKELDYSKPLETYEVMDKLQNKIHSFCQNNVKDLNEALKKMPNTAPADSVEKENSKTKKENPTPKANPEENGEKKPDADNVQKNENEIQDIEEDAGETGETGKLAEASSEKQNEQPTEKHFPPFTPTNIFENANSTNADSLSNVSIPDLAGQLSNIAFGPAHLSTFYKLVGNVVNDQSLVAEQRLLFLFQQLSSVDSMMTNTKNELLKVESQLRVDDVGESGFPHRRDEFGGFERGNFGQNPIVISNNEDRIFGDLLRKKRKESD